MEEKAAMCFEHAPSHKNKAILNKERKNIPPPLILICSFYLRDKVSPKHGFSFLEYVSTMTEDLMGPAPDLHLAGSVCL